MNIKNLIKPLPLIPLLRISPSKYSLLQQCALREIWASSRHTPLLPPSPSARVGSAIHKLLELANGNHLSGENAIHEHWDEEVNNIEKDMLSNPLERHLVPLKIYARNYEVKKILAFKMVNIVNDFDRSGTASKKQRAEVWVQTHDGKIGGKIDFIGETTNGIEIIDYKTGIIEDDSLDGQPKKVYQQQMRLYAALYHEVHKIWPDKLSLVGIDQKKYDVPFKPDECIQLLEEAKKSLDDLNEAIAKHVSPEDLASPSGVACIYCLYRPACSKYWQVREETSAWPLDIIGEIKEKRILGNNSYRILIAANDNKAIIRGLSARHHFLCKNAVFALFCNLGRGASNGFFIEKPVTTGYELQET